MNISIFTLFILTAAFVNITTESPIEEHSEEDLFKNEDLLENQAFAEDDEQWIAIADPDNHLHYVNLQQSIPHIKVHESEVTFLYSSRKTKTLPLHLSTIDQLFQTDYDPKRRTMFVSHGWTGSGYGSLNPIINAALLDVEDWNVFNLDWKVPAGRNYISAKGSLPAVAKIVADFINRLNQHGLKFENVYIAGHSLGGQLAGRIGTLLHGQVEYIIGLDPALPLFAYENLEDRLDPSDAKHVQVIHTNGGLLGYMQPLGHSDFYPNGGSKQAGCKNDYFGTCAHSRSYIYFAESIRTGKFLSHNCEDFTRFKSGECQRNNFANMGGNNLDASAHGSYYLETNPQAPFAIP